MSEIQVSGKDDPKTSLAQAATTLEATGEVWITGVSMEISRALELSEFLKERVPGLHQTISLEN